MQVFRNKYDRNNYNIINTSRRDIAAFTSVENRNRILSEGWEKNQIHSRAVLNEIKAFRAEIQRRFEKNTTKNYVFPRSTNNSKEISPST
jgi:hypothetical protein